MDFQTVEVLWHIHTNTHTHTATATENTLQNHIIAKWTQQHAFSGNFFFLNFANNLAGQRDPGGAPATIIKQPNSQQCCHCTF